MQSAVLRERTGRDRRCASAEDDVATRKNSQIWPYRASLGTRQCFARVHVRNKTAEGIGRRLYPATFAIARIAFRINARTKIYPTDPAPPLHSHATLSRRAVGHLPNQYESAAVERDCVDVSLKTTERRRRDPEGENEPHKSGVSHRSQKPAGSKPRGVSPGTVWQKRPARHRGTSRGVKHLLAAVPMLSQLRGRGFPCHNAPNQRRIFLRRAIPRPRLSRQRVQLENRCAPYVGGSAIDDCPNA